jgi:hypothetical protein
MPLSEFVGRFLGQFRSLDGFQAQVEIVRSVTTAKVDDPVPCVIGLRNTGSQPWPGRGWNPVHLTCRWHAPDGWRCLTPDGPCFPLPARGLLPGEQTILECAVPAPATPGRYLLKFELLREFVGWLSDPDSPAAQMVCQITPAPSSPFTHPAMIRDGRAA